MYNNFTLNRKILSLWYDRPTIPPVMLVAEVLLEPILPVIRQMQGYTLDTLLFYYRTT